MNNNELEKYALEDPGNVENVLEWWRDAASRYPKLSLVARKILAVPASSSASESVFSVAGRSLIYSQIWRLKLWTMYCFYIIIRVDVRWRILKMYEYLQRSDFILLLDGPGFE